MGCPTAACRSREYKSKMEIVGLIDRQLSVNGRQAPAAAVGGDVPSEAPGADARICP